MIETRVALARGLLPPSRGSAAKAKGMMVEDTKRVWSPHYGHYLSNQEAVEIIENVGRLADVLFLPGNSGRAGRS